MTAQEISEVISTKFIKEFIFRLLEAKSIRISYENKKRKVILPSNLPPTGNNVVSTRVIEEKNKTPSYFKSIAVEDKINMVDSRNPRVLIYNPEKQTKKPIANYFREMEHKQMYSPVRVQSQAEQTTADAFNLDKIKSLFLDPGIVMVECHGPNKPMSISKMGVVSTSNVFLTEEEINDFMKDVSQKTRIPLIGGLFKALLGNFLISAVVSEVVGTKFIIRRRQPNVK